LCLRLDWGEVRRRGEWVVFMLEQAMAEGRGSHDEPSAD